MHGLLTVTTDDKNVEKQRAGTVAEHVGKGSRS